MSPAAETALTSFVRTMSARSTADLGSDSSSGTWHSCAEGAACRTLLMRLMRSPHRTMIVAGAGVFWLAILIVLTLGDVLTRGWLPVPDDW